MDKATCQDVVRRAAMKPEAGSWGDSLSYFLHFSSFAFTFFHFPHFLRNDFLFANDI
jgi:hypothetical protein